MAVNFPNAVPPARRPRPGGLLRLLLAAALMALPAAAPARAKMLDCPLRDAPFSVDSPLIDVLLSAAAKTAVDNAAPGLLGRVPPFFTSTTAPTFGAIVTLRTSGEMMRWDAATLARMDAALRAVPVTDADRRARCARYDDERPAFPPAAGRPRLLLFEKMTGFRDGPSVAAAHAAFVELAARRGAALVTTDRGGAITPGILRGFDAVIWNNVSGDVLTLRQRAALKAYVEGGGGFVAVHGSGGDPVSFWDWYTDTLIGARFIGHPIAKQFQPARIVAEAGHPIAAGLPPEWTMTDEWYSFAESPRRHGARIVAALDEASYQPVGLGTQNLAMGDHPIAWTRCIGKGRAFYSAIGHRPETYAEPHYRAMLDNAISWVSAPSADACPPAAK